MAIMFPAGVTAFYTEGEARTYQWLAEVARPHDDFLVFYTPDFEGRQPDFVLYHDSIGLLVLEVKDWKIDQILALDHLTAELRIGPNVEQRENPLRQARDCANAVMDALKKDHRLLSKIPQFRDKPKIPISYGVVLFNITRDDFVSRGFGAVIEPDKIFFFDDLFPASDFCTDHSGRTFASTLAERFPPKFPCELTGSEKHFLEGVLCPQVRVNLPHRAGGGPSYHEECERLRTLDHNQEAVARKWRPGHQIVMGPSGCGKTLVLAHRAAFLKQYDPKVKRVLFVCYNIALVPYIKRLLAAEHVPLGPQGVDVVHIYELCARLLGEDVAYEREDTDYYDMIPDLALEKARAGGIDRYDAILVDEGQDFTDTMFRLVPALLNPDTDSLTIALDDGQNIYQRLRSPWKDLGINARGRVVRLSARYRNTREIAELAMRFLVDTDAGAVPPDEARPFGDDAPLASDTPAVAAGAADGGGAGVHAQLGLLEDSFLVSGPPPVIKQFPSLADAVEWIPREVLKLQDEAGYPLSEFAVLYPMRKPRATPEIDLPLTVRAALEKHGLLSRWASEDSRSKRDYDVSIDSVTVSTVHSVKGLDFSCVFLIGFDYLQPGPTWDLAEIRRLCYVAITRARTRLLIPLCQTNSVFPRITPAAEARVDQT